VKPASTRPAEAAGATVTDGGVKPASTLRALNFILTVDEDLSIRAELPAIDMVKGLMTLDRLHLDLVGIFEDWLHNRQITRRLEVEVFGSLLYQMLFTGDVRDLFEQKLQTLLRTDEQLRLRLCFAESPDLERLPWEFLYIPRSRSLSAPGDFFLAASKRLTLTRYQPRQYIQRSDEIKGPLRILLVVSNPSNLSAIDAQPLIAALKDLAATRSLSIRFLREATFNRFRHELEEYLPHLVHFIGHARSDETGTSSIALTADDGEADWVRDSHFADSFRFSRISPRLVILHTDGGSAFGPRLVKGVDNVIELRYPITNQAALTFCRDFYMAAATGETVDVAVQRARASMLTRVVSADSLSFASPAYYATSAEPTNLICPVAPASGARFAARPLPLAPG
jgi:hypothetical protein